MKLPVDTEIEQRDNGFWWPSSVKQAKMKYWEHAADMQHAVEHVKTKGIVVQAGGHVGMFPLWLAQHFQTVYTFEPEPRNFRCLVRNVGMGANVIAQRGVLSDAFGTVDLRVAGSGGGHNVRSEGGVDVPGVIPCHRIDNLRLPRLDFVMLDIEGHELPALMGGQATIERYRPVIMLEARGHGEKKGRGHTDQDVQHWLECLGYQMLKRVRNDLIFIHRGHQ